MKKVGLYCLICMVIVCFSLFNKENITIERKNYKAANTDFVSTRELAMLAALAYEDVPDDNNYTPISKSANYGCTISSDGSVSGKDSHNCFFRALDNATNSDLKRDGYSVFQYVEGLSSRKMALRPLSTLTADFREEGEDYYFLKFAKTIELENDWNIVHYATDKQLNKLPNDATFYAITYQKGNNYVIAYRGSDYPDLFEWSDNLAYAVSKDHKQALNAYTYAQNEYSRILSQNGNAKIYIVGHSIGGYLAQIGGAAIINTASNRSNANAESPKDLKDLSNYEAIYNPASNLVQVAYFNGMGFGGLNEDSDFTQNIDNALVYLGTHNRDGSRASSGRTVNYSNSVSSSGRLVLYSIDSDPASDIGLHYGEIYKLDVAADAISNHSGKHTVLFGTALKKLIETGNVADTYKEVTSMASISNSSTTLTPTTKYIPPFVLENLTGNSDTSINYNLAPVLENLDKNLKSL